jgi:hypothetical protein
LNGGIEDHFGAGVAGEIEGRRAADEISTQSQVIQSVTGRGFALATMEAMPTLSTRRYPLASTGVALVTMRMPRARAASTAGPVVVPRSTMAATSLPASRRSRAVS